MKMKKKPKYNTFGEVIESAYDFNTIEDRMAYYDALDDTIMSSIKKGVLRPISSNKTDDGEMDTDYSLIVYEHSDVRIMIIQFKKGDECPTVHISYAAAPFLLSQLVRALMDTYDYKWGAEFYQPDKKTLQFGESARLLYVKTIVDEYNKELERTDSETKVPDGTTVH